MIEYKVLLLSLIVFTGVVFAGPYTEVGIHGYIDPNSCQPAAVDDPNNIVNPIFRDWAKKVHSYSPAPGVAWLWKNPSLALGPPTGDKLDGVSLGDVNDLTSSFPPGQIIIEFSEPNNIISNKGGYDFAVFENGFVALVTYSLTGSVAGEMFAELAYVEVSTDGVNFARFPSVSLTPTHVGPMGTVEVSNIYNLAGKHSNGVENCTGTPFDLSDLYDDPMVLAGQVNLDSIKYIRIVDIPGSGCYFDQASSAGYTDPNTGPEYSIYDNDHPIYDAWMTTGSGGFDLEAIGVLNEQEFAADINLDGLVDMMDFVLFASTWQRNYGETGWIERCNLALPKDTVIDAADLSVFAGQWLDREKWRTP
jgi:hypothetical protein